MEYMVNTENLIVNTFSNRSTWSNIYKKNNTIITQDYAEEGSGGRCKGCYLLGICNGGGMSNSSSL